jgi:hypothetical protein
MADRSEIPGGVRLWKLSGTVNTTFLRMQCCTKDIILMSTGKVPDRERNAKEVEGRKLRLTG